MPIAYGPSPAGEEWTFSASIRKNGTCDQWLFGAEFSIPQIGNWGMGTGIPVGGHLSRYFSISANEFSSDGGSERAFAGIVGRDATLVVAEGRDGKRTEIHPRFPPAALRENFVWLRSFRYFLEYLPPGAPVQTVLVFNRAGTLLYRTKSQSGSF